MKRFLLYHLPAILYAGLVLALSSLRNLPHPDAGIPSLDKAAHFMEYALFAWLTYRSISNISLVRNPTVATIISITFLVGFAALDEYYQQYIPGRNSDSLDILSDTIGAAVVLGLLWLRSRRRTGTENR